jgi:hypothetical protein
VTPRAASPEDGPMHEPTSDRTEELSMNRNQRLIFIAMFISMAAAASARAADTVCTPESKPAASVANGTEPDAYQFKVFWKNFTREDGA